MFELVGKMQPQRARNSETVNSTCHVKGLEYMAVKYLFSEDFLSDRHCIKAHLTTTF